jgi:hypothetical protein
MNHFRQMKKPILLISTILLAIAILCAQGVKLHVHNFGHDHQQQFSSISSEVVTEHSHISDIHLTTDASHADHHNEVISEQNASPQALLKQISNDGPMLAVFVIAFIFLLYSAYVITLHRRFDINIAIARRYILSPPLRAPPL